MRLSVTVFNDNGPDLVSSLTLVVTGPGKYGFYDMQPITVPAGEVREDSFSWVAPDAAGTYVVEVGLSPAQLTAYVAVWLNMAEAIWLMIPLFGFRLILRGAFRV